MIISLKAALLGAALTSSGNLFLFSSALSEDEYFLAVLHIHDILVWIRIRIRGSMPLTNGFGSSYFRH